MALNQRYAENKHIAITAPADITSGDPVSVGCYRGVAQTTAKQGDRVTVWLTGSYVLPVTGAAKEGDPVYIKSGKLSTTAGGDFFGVSNGVKQSDEGDLEVAPAGIVAPTAPSADA